MSIEHFVKTYSWGVSQSRKVSDLPLPLLYVQTSFYFRLHLVVVGVVVRVFLITADFDLRKSRTTLINLKNNQRNMVRHQRGPGADAIPCLAMTCPRCAIVGAFRDVPTPGLVPCLAVHVLPAASSREKWGCLPVQS